MLHISIEGDIAVAMMNRPEKRNAMNDAQLADIRKFFSAPPASIKAAVLSGAGSHFCSGLDLAEHASRDAEATMRHSRNWHEVMDLVQFGGLPVVAALEGAVIGGGLELAAAAHVRVTDPEAFFQLPEGRRGIFVGGSASVRIGRIIGVDRLTEMMLTARKFSAAEGHVLGLAHYVSAPGGALAQAKSLAHMIAQNASLSNYMIIQALSRIGDMAHGDGLFTESLCAAVSQSSKDAAEGLAAFLEKRNPKFR